MNFANFCLNPCSFAFFHWKTILRWSFVTKSLSQQLGELQQGSVHPNVISPTQTMHGFFEKYPQKLPQYFDCFIPTPKMVPNDIWNHICSETNYIPSHPIRPRRLRVDDKSPKAPRQVPYTLAPRQQEAVYDGDGPRRQKLQTGQGGSREGWM